MPPCTQYDPCGLDLPGSWGVTQYILGQNVVPTLKQHWGFASIYKHLTTNYSVRIVVILLLLIIARYISPNGGLIVGPSSTTPAQHYTALGQRIVLAWVLALF